MATKEVDEIGDGVRPHEQHEEEAPFVGRRRDRPCPSFNVLRDTFAGYFAAVRPADGDLKPFWLARALTNPNPDPGHLNSIQLQYWTPSSFQHIDEDTYSGWDTNQGISWCEETIITPSWMHTDCIMTAWKPRMRPGTSTPRIKIPRAQISIIKESVNAYVVGDTNIAPST